eukprot:CAMPEP_0172915640 /NCGR_PEP_ID=MMETSP1075-20121228/194697_1 /TAXON_ID=2916 /ORGANISM="Ceratium fusus, Strain PA161109" /LENGTH=98 /DNA_ID=CAMNT_0013774751 /DNA_START=217 /DNA_END=510 /DNA_ORIENTATION=+
MKLQRPSHNAAANHSTPCAPDNPNDIGHKQGRHCACEPAVGSIAAKNRNTPPAAVLRPVLGQNRPLYTTVQLPTIVRSAFANSLRAEAQPPWRQHGGE